jgi:SWI/SNF-related matrix-associated actin-dependent regulator of chromatin subfamily A member 5
MERRERLQRERETLLLDDEGGTKRSTRGARAKKERKQKRKDKKKTKQEKKKKKSFGEEDDDDDDEDFVEGKGGRDADAMEVDEDEDSSSDDFSVQSDDTSSSEDSEGRPKKKKAKPAPRQLSQKQIERRQRLKEEKEQKEAVIAERQEDIRKEKAGQAKKRLEFLLKQSNIFSHFGAVKQDKAKFGSKQGEKKANAAPGLNRRESGDENQEIEMEEADEHNATRLTAQPTTLGFGKMRDYQLEGLNWMIRLQENGVNGILADEVSERRRKYISFRVFGKTF